MSVPHRKHTKGNGQNSGGREALKSRDKGTRREALLGGDKIEWYFLYFELVSTITEYKSLYKCCTLCDTGTKI